MPFFEAMLTIIYKNIHFQLRHDKQYREFQQVLTNGHVNEFVGIHDAVNDVVCAYTHTRTHTHTHAHTHTHFECLCRGQTRPNNGATTRHYSGESGAGEGMPNAN